MMLGQLQNTLKGRWVGCLLSDYLSRIVPTLQVPNAQLPDLLAPRVPSGSPTGKAFLGGSSQPESFAPCTPVGLVRK